MNNQANELPELPEAVYRSIEGKDSGTATTLLAVHRNRLAMRQSGLAELRANLSNENTHLAYLRMAISLVVFGISLNQFSQFMQEQNRVGIGAAAVAQYGIRRGRHGHSWHCRVALVTVPLLDCQAGDPARPLQAVRCCGGGPDAAAGRSGDRHGCLDIQAVTMPVPSDKHRAWALSRPADSSSPSQMRSPDWSTACWCCACSFLVASHGANRRRNLMLPSSCGTRLPGDDRPRIGLALGGGGARGIAHISVLRMIEELRDPDRLRRRHQHGRAGRRVVRLRHVGGRDGNAGRVHRLETAVRRFAGSSGAIVPAQAG